MNVHDLEFDEVLPLLSTPAAAHDRFHLDRRRFIQGAVTLGAATALPLVRSGRARAASAVGADEGILVVVFLGGGNDGLNTVAPISGAHRGTYERARGGLALGAGSLRPLDDGWGLHPSLGYLHARYRRGDVAVIQGAGLPVADLSHFTATATTMRGGTGDGTGWLGRFLDGVTESGSGMRGMVLGTSIPLYLQGRQAKVTAVPHDGAMWGADRSKSGDAALLDAVGSFAAAPSGLGPWGDAVAQSTAAAVGTAATISKVFQPTTDATGLPRDLVLAARLLNADLGARVVGVTLGGWDTHIAQGGVHQAQLTELDHAIEAFFATLAPRFRNRVTMLVQSEFGRRPEANASFGTDHGTAGLQLVIGSGVRGGRHGAPPALDRLDDRGNVVPTVDFREAYAQILDRWLRADSKQLLGGRFSGLDLFSGSPRP